MRPKVAPTAMEGTKMPAGTLQPYERMTRKVRSTVARSSELTIRHWAQDLWCKRKPRLAEARQVYILAKTVVVAAALALSKKDIEALGHVNSEELVEVPNQRRQRGEYHSLLDPDRRKVPSSKSRDLEVVLCHEGAVQASKYSDHDEKADLEEVPVAVVRDLEEYQLSRAEWVHCLWSRPLRDVK